MTDEHVFEVAVFGTFRPGQVRVDWHEKPRPPHAELDALIEKTWAEKLAECENTGRLLFNGQLTRCLAYRVENGELLIDAGPTDYANFVGTNLFNHERGDEFGWDLFSNPIGTSATLITSDGWLLLGRRNHRVAFYGGYVHMFGGALEAVDHRDDGTVDAFGSISRELKEELALSEADIKEIVCLGLIAERRIRQPELIFETTVPLTQAEIANRIRPGHPDEEHTGIVACRDEPGAIVPFLRATEPIAPVAVGALCQHGRRRFGQPWYEAALSELAKR